MDVTVLHNISMQAQIYSIIKSLDPYHLTIGGVGCQNSFLFRDVASLIPPTVSRSSNAWMGEGQPALQLSLDLVCALPQNTHTHTFSADISSVALF